MTVSRTSKLLSQLDQHFGKCAVLAAAGAGVGMVSAPQTAEAAIVHVNANVPIPSTSNGLYMNVVGYSTLPATPNINEPGNTTGLTVPGWDINPYGNSTTSVSFWNAAVPAGGTYVLRTGGGNIGNLPAGTLIGPASVYSSTQGTTGVFTGAQPLVLNSNQNIVGFRFQDEIAQCVKYGWLRVGLGAAGNSQPRTLVEYAYENTCATGIEAGAVPEPGSLALLAMGAAGMFIRRRK